MGCQRRGPQHIQCHSTPGSPSSACLMAGQGAVRVTAKASPFSGSLQPCEGEVKLPEAADTDGPQFVGCGEALYGYPTHPKCPNGGRWCSDEAHAHARHPLPVSSNSSARPLPCLRFHVCHTAPFPFGQRASATGTQRHRLTPAGPPPASLGGGCGQGATAAGRRPTQRCSWRRSGST